MANLLLTEVCVRKCPYCFAKQYMEGVEDRSAITKDNLVYVVNFLEKSGINRISLLGGEPLIHPRVAEIIEYLILDRGFEVCIFTSGIMPSNKLEPFVKRMQSESIKESNKLKFVVNVNEPHLSSQSELLKVHNFLMSLGNLCALSFNIYRLDYNIDFLKDYILKYGLRRHVRFGIANPIPGSHNEYIAPADFKQAKIKLMDGLRKMYDLKIHPGLDCGFPMCMFSDEEIGLLYKYTRNALSFDCGPTIDIGPDLNCWTCFPLSSVNRKSLKDFQTYDELYSYFNMIQENYRKEIRGIYQECDTCKNYEMELCSGGCLAHTLNHFHEEGHFRQ